MAIINEDRGDIDAQLLAALVGGNAPAAPASEAGQDPPAPAPAPAPASASLDPRHSSAIPPHDYELVTEFPATEAPEDTFETEAPVTEPPVEEPAYVKEMRAELGSLRGVLQQSGLLKPKEEPRAKPALDASKFLLTQEELDQVLDRPELINAKLQALAEQMSTALGSTMQPEDVQTIVDAVVTAKTKTEEFYKTNPDLNTPGMKRFVQTVLKDKHAEIMQRGGAVDLDALLKDTAIEVRRSLGLKKPVQVRKEKVPSKDEPAKKTPDGKPSAAAPRPNAKPPGTAPSLPATKSARRAPEPSKRPVTQQDIIREVVGGR